MSLSESEQWIIFFLAHAPSFQPKNKKKIYWFKKKSVVPKITSFTYVHTNIKYISGLKILPTNQIPTFYPYQFLSLSLALCLFHLILPFHCVTTLPLVVAWQRAFTSPPILSIAHTHTLVELAKEVWSPLWYEFIWLEMISLWFYTKRLRLKYINHYSNVLTKNILKF